MLRNHDGRGTVVGSPDPGHGETVPQTGEIACATSQLDFLLVDNARVIEVSCGDDGVSSQTIHRLETFGVLVVLHEPARRLGAEEDTDEEDKGGDECRPELEAPGDATGVFDDDVCAETQEDT